jgi:hypothetical protein
MNGSLLLALSAAALLGSPLCAFAQGPATGSSEKPYRVVGGKVDDTTFRGWRAYNSACHACHGADGVGTSVAPNLLESVKSLSARDFTTKVLTSYRIVIGIAEFSGEDNTSVRERIVEEVLRRESGTLAMPAWEQNSKVRPHVLDLYAYLRARSDGALGPGRPQRLNSSETTDSGEDADDGR